MKHTPGPWALRPHGVIVGGREIELVGGLVIPQIAMACGHETCGPDEQAANARLIAASPDLLDALKAFTEAAESWHKFHHGTDIQCDEICASIPAAKSAIAKAEA